MDKKRPADAVLDLREGREVWLRSYQDVLSLRGKSAEIQERGRWSGPHLVTKVARAWATVQLGPHRTARVRLDDGGADPWKSEYGSRAVALSEAEVECRVWDAAHRNEIAEAVRHLSTDDLIAVARLIGHDVPQRESPGERPGPRCNEG